MKDHINISLNKILGKSYIYKGESLYFENFKQLSTGKICITTHIKTINFLESEIPDFLEQLEECKNLDFRDKAIVAENTRALEGYTPSAENIVMKSTLMEMLSKVKTSASAIPQAKAACEIVNSMINIQKNELQMIQMVQRSSKKNES